MKRVPRRQLIGTVVAILFAAPFWPILPANAQTFSSSYTSTAPKDCRTIGKPSAEDGSTQVCPGQSGLMVVISEGDLRQTVSVGRTREAAAKEPAAETWFGPFNSTANTVEWRAVDGKPFAIIQRWLIADIDNPDKTGNPTSKPMLAVTRLPPGPVCHVAYIDGQANRNANELARQAADEFARDFKCGKDEVKVIGEKGAAVGLAKR
ncbi:hypothetical protein CQ12_35045 [Bradyrhizobium jicamae]|uniref:Uncharacterized protein n=1 Tax=Bradyrhizobium jicamae TaxID=280332 RepID=A0A0R3M234_9BRAD|nr:hypothetical protein [Bradyrhizobium jicamae]KRR14137.1 hypothetical protein CQ12_35045 [Bradyrhizobium jicamae]